MNEVDLTKDDRKILQGRPVFDRVESMSSDGKLRKAYERAKASVTREGSYSNVWKAIDEIGLMSNQ